MSVQGTTSGQRSDEETQEPSAQAVLNPTSAWAQKSLGRMGHMLEAVAQNPLGQRNCALKGHWFGGVANSESDPQRLSVHFAKSSTHVLSKHLFGFVTGHCVATISSLAESERQNPNTCQVPSGHTMFVQFFRSATQAPEFGQRRLALYGHPFGALHCADDFAHIPSGHT